MRSNLVIGVLVLGLAAMAAWFLAVRKAAQSSDLPTPLTADQSADAGATNVSPGTKPAPEASKEPVSPAIAVTEGAEGADEAMAGTPQAKHEEAYIANRVAELQDLGMEDDAGSLHTILSELNNGDATIRRAAVDAAVQFGSRDAIPNLTQAAAQADDPKEKSAILDAIEFLKLPTLADALAQSKSNALVASPGVPPER